MSAARPLAVAAALVVGAGLSAGADPVPAPAKQKAAQQKVQGKVADAARRTASTLEAMTFQRLSPTAEAAMLDEVAGGLKGLTEEEIAAVLNHLDAAAAAPDAASADAAQGQAEVEHRRVVARLRGLLSKVDLVKSLDEAAARLDRAADDQLTVNGETLASAARKAGKNPRPTESKEELGDKQAALSNEVGSVLKQLDALLPSLSADQKARAEKADLKAKSARLAADLPATAKTVGKGEFDEAAERQRRHAKELKDLAAALRAPPGDQLAALKAAREKVDAAAKAQEKLNGETAGKPDANPNDEERPARRERPESKVARGQDLANAQTKAEFATREARKATEPVAPEVADVLKPAETQQWKAEDKLRAGDLNTAKEPQAKALDALKAARDELDKRIAAAELAKNDPLAAVKQAGEQIEKLIQDQKAAAAKTDEAAKDDGKLKDAAKAQKDVGRKTDDLRKSPAPPNDAAKEALAKAAEAMKKADQDLAAKDPAGAKPDQKDAVKALEEAKQALDQQAAAIEKRRDDIAKLEEAKKKLDELAKAEQGVADDAKKAAADAKPDPKDPAGKDVGKPDTKALADKQGELQKPTADLAKDLKDAAPEAAQKAAEAGQKQDAAKQDLAKNDAAKGAEKAADAAKKLDEAGKAVDQQLAEKRGQEANDQQALKPESSDPANAQQQLAKAAEQAMKAADKANEAAKALNPQKPMNGQPPKPMPGQPTLNELQKQVAKESGAAKQDDAAKAAGEAAQALDQGDLPAAVEQQQKALDALEQAAKDQPAAKPADGQKAPGQLAQDQKKLLEATKALQQSQRANEAAKAALAQAQANAPMAVQPQLDQAGEALKQAGDQLGQGQPDQAGMNQSQAADALGQAMEALKAAGMGQPMPGEGDGKPMPGQGEGQPGQGKEPGKGTKPGTKPGEKPGEGDPQNEGTSEGDQNGPEKLKNAGVSGEMKTGDGGFINLRKRERDSVRQAGGEQFPAEFRELIKQYNINIKKTDPAPAKPAAPPKK